MQVLKRSAAILICLFIAAPAAADSVSTLNSTNNFRTLLADSVAGGDIIGVAAVVVRNGEIDYLDTYGYRELGSPATIDAETVFRIASLSKGMAASIVAQLVAEGRADLSEPVAKFAPELRLKQGAERLTIEHALSHRTSLPPYAYDNLLEAGVAPSVILDRYGDVDPICDVGKCYAYQNIVFDTAARLIELRDSRNYAASIQRRLFDPLEMHRASTGLAYCLPDDNWARPHRRKRNRPWQTTAIKKHYYDIPAAGGVNASINDMSAWLKVQLGHAPEVLSSDMLAMLHQPRIDTPGEVYRVRNDMPNLTAAHYGLGWRIYDYAGERVIAHAGSVDGGFSARIALLPDRDVGIVLLTNSPSEAFSRLLPAFLDEELGLAR